MKALMLVEDHTTAANLRAYSDPDKMTIAVINAPFPKRKYDAIFVRYPSPNWFTRKEISPLAFSTYIRMNVTGFLKPGSTFQYI